MDNFRGLLGIRRMERMPNAKIKLCQVMKGMDERTGESVLLVQPYWKNGEHGKCEWVYEKSFGMSTAEDVESQLMAA